MKVVEWKKKNIEESRKLLNEILEKEWYRERKKKNDTMS